jgi:6,7-dimethyl-8-ribityllumazine synthase
MLTAVKKKMFEAEAGRIAIVASEYNAKWVNPMVEEAQAELRAAGLKSVQVVRVPGAFEIPVVAARLALEGAVGAIICLGVILRGETTHAQHIGEAVSQALAQVQIQHGVPVIHEVLLLENEEQARARCLGKEYNRGREAAQTALAMAALMKRFANPDSFATRL